MGERLVGYADMDLSQGELGREYAAAEVFVVGSWFEGFCQPGLEALACGVPLVTTDNGGCLEYAIDGETALVVPPRDPVAMAQAIGRLLDDPVLAATLRANGLELVAQRFDWDTRAAEFGARLEAVADGSLSAPPPARPVPPPHPQLSVVTPAWDNLNYTQKFAESVRQHTDVSYELIVVDNGSAAEAARYAAAVADTVVLNDENLGFSTGMNQGLEASHGDWVAFCNNDTILPPHWASMLLETAKAHPTAGIIVPALTAARNPHTVRDTPGDFVEVLPPFSAPPAAVIYLMRADLVREIGGWPTDYKIASGEDVDLAFTVWTNDLDIIYDSRVLVDHIGKGTASRLEDWQTLWADNRNHFLTKWSSDAPIPRIAACPPERHHRNRQTAASTTQWMQRYFHTRDEYEKHRRQTKKALAKARAKSTTQATSKRLHLSSAGRRVWRKASPYLPPRVRAEVRRRGRAILKRLS